ncbi:MAG: hypothetical protein ACOH18_03490 [Candidatus Saccharimonadaceae bacterium]
MNPTLQPPTSPPASMPALSEQQQSAIAPTTPNSVIGTVQGVIEPKKITRSKISRGWKIGWISACIVSLLEFIPLYYFFNTNAASQEGDVASALILILFFPLILVLSYAFWVVVAADVVFIIATLFYLLKREQEYSKRKAFTK